MDFLEEVELASERTEENQKPFHMVVDEKKETRLLWFQEVVDALIEQSRKRATTLAIVTGKHNRRVSFFSSTTI